MSSIYSQIGGYEALEVVVNDFYGSVLAASLTAAGVPSATVDQILAAIAPLSTEIATASVA